MCENVDFDYLNDDFYYWRFGIANFFACGAKLRLDKDNAWDHRGAAGLKLKFCHEKYWDVQYEETIYYGHTGEWQEEYAMCNNGHFVTGG